MVMASPAPAAPAYGQNSHRRPREGVPAAPSVRLLNVKHREQTEPTSPSPAPHAEPLLSVDTVTTEWLHLLPEVQMRLGRAWRPKRKATFCAEVRVLHRASPGAGTWRVHTPVQFQVVLLVLRAHCWLQGPQGLRPSGRGAPAAREMSLSR